MTTRAAPLCVYCAHRYGDDRRCRAFPEGIPDAIWESRHDHRELYTGDRGYTFRLDPTRLPDGIELADILNDLGFADTGSEI